MRLVAGRLDCAAARVGATRGGSRAAPTQSDTDACPMRMKIEPPDTAIDASVAPSSSFVASFWNAVPGAMTVATPSSLRK